MLMIVQLRVNAMARNPWKRCSLSDMSSLEAHGSRLLELASILMCTQPLLNSQFFPCLVCSRPARLIFGCSHCNVQHEHSNLQLTTHPPHAIGLTPRACIPCTELDRAKISIDIFKLVCTALLFVGLHQWKGLIKPNSV